MTKVKIKPIVMIDLPEGPRIGGPISSVSALMHSSLSEEYEFKILYYRYNMGRFISWNRIEDLKNQILAIKPDIIHISGLQLSGFHLAVAARLAGVPRILMTIHGSSRDAISLGWFKRKVMQFIIEPLTLLIVDYFYGVSKFVDRWWDLKLYGKKKLSYIYNLPPVQVDGSRAEVLRSEIGVHAGTLVVGTVGRVTKDKGYHVLSRAIQELSDLGAVAFLVVGDGEYLPEMRLELSKEIGEGRVITLGARHDVQDILSACDLFVLPTLHETLSIVLLEASVQALPLIASNTGGVPEILEHGVNGLLVPPGDPMALASAIRLVINDKELRMRFARNARSRVDRIFSRSEIIRDVGSIYTRLMNEE